MEYKYPIAKEDGKDYTAAELYGKLSNERAGHYLLSANGFWHGGIHFSTPNISEKTSVQAIAEGTVIAYRINKEYETIPATTPPEGYKYSTGFCLIKHSIPVEKSDQLKQEEAKAATEQNIQDNKKEFEGKKVTVNVGPRAYRVVEGITKDNVGTYAKGTELEVISIGDELKSDYYFAKVKKAQADPKITEKEYYVAFLDKEGNPIKDSKGTQVFEIPVAKETGQAKVQENQSENTPANKEEEKKEGETEAKKEPEDKKNPNIFNLEFYSLYMHLSAYEDYEPKKEEPKKDAKKENEQVTIKATGLSIRDKHRNETGSTVIGKVSNGAVLEVLETKESINKTFTDIKAKLISGSFTDSKGTKLENITEAWVPTRQDKKSFIEDKKADTKKVEEKKRPSYWEGTVTAVVKKADGIEIWQTLEGEELKTSLGSINQGNQFTFDSTNTKTITINKKTLLIAECTAIGTFNFRKTGEQPKGKFWTTVDKDSITRTKVEPTTFNSVVSCDVKVIAGEPLGYLGTYETPSKTDDKNSKKQVHVELFTPDLATVDFLLNNPFKLTGKKYIKIPKGTKLLGTLPQLTVADSAPVITGSTPAITGNTPVITGNTPTPTNNGSVTTGEGTVANAPSIPAGNMSTNAPTTNYIPTTANSGAVITGNTPTNSGTITTGNGTITTPNTSPTTTGSLPTPATDYTTKQDHYLAIDKLTIEKQATSNVEYYKIAVELHTGYIKKEGLAEIDQYDWAKLGFQKVEESDKNADGYLDPKSMPTLFQQIYSKIDTNKDGKLQQDELKVALKDQGIRDQWAKLIAKHPSEWKKDNEATKKRFTKLLTNPAAPEDKQKEAKELLEQETKRMDKLAFLEDITPSIPPILYHFHPVTFVEYQENINGPLTIPLLIALGVSKKNAEKYVNVLNTQLRKYKMTSPLRVGHFISQVLTESGYLVHTKELGTSLSYDPWRGRGLIQVTLKGNYEKYGKFVSEDVTTGTNYTKLESSPHSVSSAIWFWEQNAKLTPHADKDDFIWITRVINGGFNGYDHRREILNKFIKETNSAGHFSKNTDKVYKFEDSKAYNEMRASFAWGLWNDPSLSKNGITTKTKIEALKGYKRFVALHDAANKPTQNGKWYGYADARKQADARIIELEK